VTAGIFPADACGNVQGAWQRFLAEVVSTMRLGEFWNLENGLCPSVAHVRVAGEGTACVSLLYVLSLR
jgi:hypothetical protein